MAQENEKKENGEKRTPSQFFLELSKTKMPRINEDHEINDFSQNKINNILINRDLKIKNEDITPVKSTKINTSMTDGVIPKQKNFIKEDKGGEKKEGSEEDTHLSSSRENYESPPKIKTKRSHSKRGLLFITVFVIISTIFTLSKLFNGATVYIKPKTSLSNISIDLNMKRDSDDGLSFERVNLSASLERDVISMGVENVEIKSTGRVILYNNYSTSSQKLLINTRLESPDGKIYFTDTATTIPGRTTKGGETIPGSIEVGITAEKPGEEYNGEPKDFVFVGFKGTSKEKGFYARGKGSTTGGFIGEIPVVSEEEKQTAISAIKNELETKLLSDVSLQVPTGYIVRKDLSFFSFSEPKILSKESRASVSISGNIESFIIPIDIFDKTLAEKNIEDYSGEDIRIENRDSLSISLKNKDIIDNPGNLTSTEISISGESLFVFNYNKEELINNLALKKKRDFNGIISSYPEIEKGELVLKPFFATTLPKAENIVLIEDLSGTE